jgi:ComEC/Rec2-related protein
MNLRENTGLYIISLVILIRITPIPNFWAYIILSLTILFDWKVSIPALAMIMVVLFSPFGKSNVIDLSPDVIELQALCIKDIMISENSSMSCYVKLQNVGYPGNKKKSMHGYVRVRFSGPLKLVHGEELHLKGSPSTWYFMVEDTQKLTPAPWLYRMKAGLRFETMNRMMDYLGNRGHFFSSITQGLSGDSRYLFYDSFRNTGLVHLLVLSGTHASILFLLLGKICRNKFFQLLLFALYVWYCDVPPPLLRVLLTRMFMLIQPKAVSSVRILLLSFILQALFFTQSFYAMSLVLSYGAVFGILLLSQYKPKSMTILSRLVGRGIESSLYTGLSASAGIFPLLLVYGIPIQPLSWLWTLVLIPFLSLNLITGFIFFFLIIGDIALPIQKEIYWYFMELLAAPMSQFHHIFLDLVYLIEVVSVDTFQGMVYQLFFCISPGLLILCICKMKWKGTLYISAPTN